MSSDLLLRFRDGAFRVIFFGTESTNSLEVKDPSLILVHHPVILSLFSDTQTEIGADFIFRYTHTSEGICSSLDNVSAALDNKLQFCKVNVLLLFFCLMRKAFSLVSERKHNY